MLHVNLPAIYPLPQTNYHYQYKQVFGRDYLGYFWSYIQQTN
jgi:ABC-type polysaccharide/polyol phosphate export permease